MANPEQQLIKNAVAALPPVKEVRLAIAHNLRERQLLRQLLKLSEQRERVQEVSVGEAV
jgi:hypothetical protein